MNYCYQCGSALKDKIVPPDDRQRETCPKCGYIHYQSPTVLVGTFLFHQDKLFWIKRGIEPQKGLWTFPGGFLESGETVREAAARELFEETRIKRSPEDMIPFGILSLVTLNQVYLTFRCHCESFIEASATQEVEQSGWFNEEEAPWSEIAHGETAEQVHLTYRLLREGKFPLRINDIVEQGVINTKLFSADD